MSRKKRLFLLTGEVHVDVFLHESINPQPQATTYLLHSHSVVPDCLLKGGQCVVIEGNIWVVRGCKPTTSKDLEATFEHCNHAKAHLVINSIRFITQPGSGKWVVSPARKVKITACLSSSHMSATTGERTPPIKTYTLNVSVKCSHSSIV